MRDRRGGGIAGTIAALVASGEPVLVVAADARARLRHLRPILGGFALCSHDALERDPGAGARGGATAHVVMLDPPAGPLRTYGAMTHLAWGPPELRFAAQIHEREYALRASLTATYRALRAAGAAAGEELETLLRGDAKTPRPAALAGRVLRVLAELHLVSLDPDSRTVTVPSAERTALERSAAFRAYQQRYEDGLHISERGDSKGGVRAPARQRVVAGARRAPVDAVSPGVHPPVERADLTELERSLLSDVFAIVEEHADASAVQIDRTKVEAAFVFSCEHHADQRRMSGEEFIVHPVGVAKICAGMRLDTETLCAALLHDTVEDTSASLVEVRAAFGDEIANLVDGVTKLTGIVFQSRDEAQAENYRKMMVAMANDVRVILIKLADRLHNMRTIAAMPKQKQIDKAKETLEIYAPIAHRLGIHAIKWELEDLAFQALHPRKYAEIKGLVNQQRDERESYVEKAGAYLRRELEALGIEARHLRARQALLLDLLEDDEEGPRVQRDLRPHGDARDRRLGEGLLRRGRRRALALEAAARALQGLHRDAEVQHVPVAAHDGDRARGAAAGDPDPHARDAGHGGVRRRRALDLQGRRRTARPVRRPTATRSSSGCARCSNGSRTRRTPRSSWTR